MKSRRSPYAGGMYGNAKSGIGLVQSNRFIRAATMRLMRLFT